MTQDPYSPYSAPNTPAEEGAPAPSTPYGAASAPGNPYGASPTQQGNPYAGAPLGQQANPYAARASEQQANPYAPQTPSQPSNPYTPQTPGQPNPYQGGAPTPYPGPYAYPVNSQQDGWQPQPIPAAPAQKRSPVLGIISLVLGVGLLIGGVFGAADSGSIWASTFYWLAENGYGNPEQAGAYINEVPSYLLDPLYGSMGLLLGLSLLALITLILGIVAAVRKSGRVFAVFAIILAVAGPIISFAVWYSVLVSQLTL